MGSSTDDLINQIQLSQAQQGQPGIFGVNAPPDPTKMAALLQRLQDQRYIDQVAQPTPGDWGFLHDAGRVEAARAGQILGHMLFGALNPAPKPVPQGPAFTLPGSDQSGRQQSFAPNSAPQSSGDAAGAPAPPSPVQMPPPVQQAARAYQAMLASGIDEGTARTNATKMLAQAGVADPQSAIAQAIQPNQYAQQAMPPAPIPNPGANQSQTMQNMIAAARYYNQSLIKNGMGADQARVQTLTQMSQWGAPVEDELAKAQAALLGNQHVAGETIHNLAQARGQDAGVANMADEQANRARERSQEDQRIGQGNQHLDIERANLRLAQAKAAADAGGDIDFTRPLTAPAREILAQAAARGDIAMPTAASRIKGAQEIAARALSINPELTQATFPSRQKALVAITSGPQGNQVRSFNVAYNHLDTVSAAVDALDNGDMPAFNSIVNRIATQTGSPLPTNLDTGLQMIKGELAKAIIAAHPPEGMVNKMLAGVDSASATPALRGAMDQAKELMLGQASGVKQQFNQSVTGRQFNFDDALSPSFKRDLSAYETKRDGRDGASGATTSQTAPSGWTLQVDGNGRRAYVSPDGKQFKLVK